MIYKDSKPLIIIAIIPFFLLILNLFFIKDLGPVYMSCFDPAYNYLFNGLNLARGYMEIGHIDHPGTPVQMFSAFVIRIVYLFRNDISLTDSVLNNPEIYLKSIQLSLILLNILALFYLGKSVYKQTRSVYKGIFFQLTPLISLVSIYFMNALGCESSLLLLSILLIILIFNYPFDSTVNISTYYILKLSIISALLITVKVSAAPILVIPLIILPGFFNKLKYTVLTIVFTSIILIPIYDKLSHFLHFIYGIFTHLGQYGQGQEGILDFNEYFHNLVRIFTTEFPFTISFPIILISSFLCACRYKYFINATTLQKKLLYSFSIVMVLQVLIVARQFSFHYLLPAYTLAIPGIYTIFIMIYPNVKYFRKITKNQKTIILIIAVILLFIRAIVYFNFFPGLKNPAFATIGFIQKNKHLPRVILADRYKESAFIEQAFYFGTSYSGSFKSEYRKLLATKYPQTFFYSLYEEVTGWNNRLMKEELLFRFPEILLYVKYLSDKQCNEFITQFQDLKLPHSFYKYSLVYNNAASHEKIYLLKSDIHLIRKWLKPSLSIFCDMETCSNDSIKLMGSAHRKTLRICPVIADNKDILEGRKYQIYEQDANTWTENESLSSKQYNNIDVFMKHVDNEKYEFDKAYLRTTEKSFDGKYSVKLNPKLPYGCDIQLKAKAGDFFRIQVRRFSQNSDGLIVASSG